MARALIVQGGWVGHDPENLAKLFSYMLESEGVTTEIVQSLDILADQEKLMNQSLVVPIWSIGEITDEQVHSVSEAVASGVGLAGCHGGMCGAFKNSVLWHFITGGQWVAHPGDDGTEYIVNIKKGSSPLVEGIADFTVCSEQYYMHVDPAIEILATTRFPLADGHYKTNNVVDMPVVWTKRWGKGKVYYNSLGHTAKVFDVPEAKELMRRGFLWAMKGN